MNRSKRGEILVAVGALAGILVFLVLIFDTNLFHLNYRMDSDLASDVILGELIWKSRQIVPDTWYIASEARIICNPNVAAIFYGIVKDMTLATGLACCVMTLMVLVSVLVFCRLSGMKKNDGLAMGFMCLAFPASFVSLELLYLFASYYAIHTVILFLTLGVYTAVLQSRKINFVKLIFCMAPAFVLGMQGVRGILVVYGPLMGIEVFRNIYILYRRKKRDRLDNILVLWVMLLLAFSFLGTCFPVSVGQGFSRNIRKGFQKLWTVVLPDIRRSIGFDSTNIAGKICLVILILLCFWILTGILFKMWKKDEIEPVEWAWLMIFSSPIITALIVAFTTVESTERYYFLLIFLMAFSVVLVCKKNIGIWKGVAASVAVILAVQNFFFVYFPVIKGEDTLSPDVHHVIEYLEENDYRTAYATFEHANMMTVISNGKVRVYPVASVEKMSICKWMASTEWYCPSLPFEQKTAYIVTDTEENEFEKFMKGKEDEVQKTKEIGKYKIYVSDYNFSNLGGTE